MPAPSARPSRPFIAVLLIALLSLLATAAPAAAKPKRPDLKAATVSATPRAVDPGDELTASGRVRNSGPKLGRGRVDVYLSPRQVAKPRGAELGRDRVAVDPRSSAQYSVSGEVPADLGEYDEGSATNRYYAVACIKRRGSTGPPRCAVAESPTRVRAFAPGARSLGDPLFPQLGNGGYDAENYDISISYDPGDPSPDDGPGGGTDQEFLDGTSTTMTATATQNLSEFSLDFQQFDVSEVLVDGEPAEFDYEDTEEFADPAVATQFTKLVVTPAAGIREGEEFTVEVDYSGTPDEMTDADGSIEGWIQACRPDATDRVCDGSFTVNEPNGTQTWAPVNNVPDDKASVDTAVTVPTGKTALGAGELTAPPADNGDGTTTWSWSHAVPTSPYLYSATVGDFDYSETSMTLPESGGTIPIYTAIDSAGDPVAKTAITNTFGQIPTVQNYLSRNLFGAYPYGSTGGVADWTDNVFYALENASKPHYSGDEEGPSVSASTQVHELTHQWMGDSVGPETWIEIGFNEGWATWTTWEYQYESGADVRTPAARADTVFNSTNSNWSIPPADFSEPADLFAGSQYNRTAAMIQYYREIVGERSFLTLAGSIPSEYGGGVISWDEYVAESIDASGFTGARADRLEEFFEQWLYSDSRPDITPESF